MGLGHVPPVAPASGARRRFESSLSGLPVLDEIPMPIRDRLGKISRLAAYARDELILHEGADTPFLGIVRAGVVALRLHVPGRGVVTILTAEPGDLIGWSAVVPPYRSTASAVALEASEIVALDAAPLREQLSADPGVAAAILPLVLGTLSSRLSAAWVQLLDLFGEVDREPW
jgi:CRP/FNR family cyclic AMP-dependent transcriptional regulator